MTLDTVDRRLLQLVQQDADLPNRALAEQVGLSPSSCHGRVKRLRSLGLLHSAHAVVSPEALGVGLQGLISVRLATHTRDVLEDFRQYAMSIPEVMSLAHVTGRDDFLMRVAVRDARHLSDLMLDAFNTRDEVAHLQTSLIFDRWTNPVLPDLT